MAKTGPELVEEGWQQIRAGVALIIWSRLASWDARRLVLIPVGENAFESAAGHRTVHEEFGRLLCWIAFGVGGEYLAKGACLVKGLDLSCDVTPIRIPALADDFEEWARRVNANDPSIRESATGFGTLGKVPVDKILNPGPERDLAFASIKLLASTIRNRDAHRYVRGVRSFHFHAVEKLFVPAFNTLVASLDQSELRVRLSGL